MSVIILYLLSFATDRKRSGAYCIVIRVIGSEVGSPLAIYSTFKRLCFLICKTEMILVFTGSLQRLNDLVTINYQA